jgi:hypothetical protein
MKRLLLVLILMPALLFGQNSKEKKPSFTIPEPSSEVSKSMMESIPTKDDKIIYDTIINVDTSLKSKVIFTRVRQWFAEKFLDSKSVLQVNDIDNGILTGIGTYKYYISNGLNMHAGFLRFTLNVAVKDGKYRYQLYNFNSDEQNTSILSTNGQSYAESVNFDQVYYMHTQGKRASYTRKYLQEMINLVYYINTTLPKEVSSANISEF